LHLKLRAWVPIMIHIKLVEKTVIYIYIYVCNEPIQLIHRENNSETLKLWRLPNIEVYNQNILINIGPTISSKRTMLGKAYGTKWGAIGNMLRKTLGTWRICLDHIGNLKGTHWEQNPTPTYPPQKQKQKQKKTGSIGCMLLALVHWLIFSNCVHHYFFGLA